MSNTWGPDRWTGEGAQQEDPLEPFLMRVDMLLWAFGSALALCLVALAAR